MSFTVDNVISDVRLQLRDVIDGAYNWTETELVKYINDGQNMIFKLHPEAVVTDEDDVTATFGLTAVVSGDTILLADQYRSVLADYVVERASGVDSMGANPAQSVTGNFIKTIK